MVGSSGTMIREWIEPHECPCGYEGEVTAFSDPEINHLIIWWECPACEQEHEYEQAPYGDDD